MTRQNNTPVKASGHNRPGHGGGNPISARTGEKSKDFKGTLKKLAVYLKPYYKGLLFVLLFALISTVFGILGPKILGMAVDELFHGMMDKVNHVPGAAINFHSIAKILLVLLCLYVLSAVFNYIQEYMMAGVSQRIIRQMRDDVSQKLHHLPLKFFDTKTHGEILSRVTNDIDTISSTFQQSLIQLITSIITLIGITVMMLIISPMLSLVAFLSLPLCFVVTALIARRSQKYFIGQQKELGALNGHVEEMYGAHNVVKAFSYEKKSIDDFNQTNEALYRHGWKAQFVTSVIFPVLNFIGNLAYVGVCVLGGYLTAVGHITLGSVQAFITYSRQFNQPIMQVANIVNVLQSTVAAAERIFEILGEQEEIPDPVPSQQIESPQGHVCFNDISFRYTADKPLIDNISMEIKSGDTVAIVGPTGAGKTTLVNLLMRFYELDGGDILIDNVPTTQMTRKNLHLLFGMVLQDTWLFNGTIRDNIAYGKEGATDDEVVEAARMAFADNFIRTFPEGYQTVINEEGSNISQGEKQLITIARAIISQPAIMILDEATSSVDTRTELLIQKAMKQLMAGRTSFVIAHRLSTIRDADCILVMNHGSIIEQGTHRELLEQNGFYAELYNSQFAGEAPENI